MRPNTFSYFALVDRDKAPGVVKKIASTALAAENLGLNASCKLYSTTASGAIDLVISLLKDKADVIMIRFSDLIFPVLFFAILIKRIRGSKIIIDIPTPRVVVLKELDIAIRNPIKRGFRKALMYFSAAWVLYPAHKIVQYADEGLWFSWGVEKKTKKIGNGIVIDEKIPLTKSHWPDDELRLIGVAQLASWHGYDRLISALATLKNKQDCGNVRLTIVGAGNDSSVLKSLVYELKLQDRVSFTGMLTGSELDKAFESAHVGISSLGLYRKGLNEASDLKTREYMARGLSVIGVGKDPDFDDDSPFRFVVANDNSTADLAELISSFGKRKLPLPEEVRRFAKEKLSLEGKLSDILDMGWVCD